MLDCLTLIMKALWSFRMLAGIEKSAEYNITEDVDLWNLHHYQSCFLSLTFYSEYRGHFKNEQTVDHSFQICRPRRTVSLCTHTVLELQSIGILFSSSWKRTHSYKRSWSSSFPWPWRRCVAKQICICIL